MRRTDSLSPATTAPSTMNGIACLTGSTATQAQKDLCDSAVASNTTAIGAQTVGKVIAVASLLAAAHSCE